MERWHSSRAALTFISLRNFQHAHSRQEHAENLKKSIPETMDNKTVSEMEKSNLEFTYNGGKGNLNLGGNKKNKILI